MVCVLASVKTNGVTQLLVYSCKKTQECNKTSNALLDLWNNLYTFFYIIKNNRNVRTEIIE